MPMVRAKVAGKMADNMQKAAAKASALIGDASYQTTGMRHVPADEQYRRWTAIRDDPYAVQDYIVQMAVGSGADTVEAADMIGRNYIKRMQELEQLYEGGRNA